MDLQEFNNFWSPFYISNFNNIVVDYASRRKIYKIKKT